MTIDELKDKARYYARLHDLDGSLVCAVIEQESNWATWSIRFEPDFETRYVVKLHLGPTECTARSISWGLMQLMGECAREMGFEGKLASLCDPDIGLEWGCRHLKAKLDAHGGDVTAGLLAWNGGGNPDYAAEAMARMDKYSA